MISEISKGMPIPGQPLTTEQVLRDEAEQIHGCRIGDTTGGTELNLELNRLGSSALCISGGGIRSATFALGMIQALAANPRTDSEAPASSADSLLGRFNYLSTVSGGGYIGSWLSAWLSRQPFSEVVRQLSGRPAGAGVEPSPIEDLRRDSNYLTPRIGLVSADTWAAAAMFLRSIFLIWLLVLSVAAVFVLGLKLGFAGLTAVPGFIAESPTTWPLAVSVALGAACILLAQRFTLVNYARHSGTAGQGKFLRRDLLLSLAGDVFWTIALATPPALGLLNSPVESLLLPACPAGAVLFAMSWVLAGDAGPAGKRWSTGVKWTVVGAVYGAVLVLGASLLSFVAFLPAKLLVLAMLAPPWVLLAQITAETCFVALTSNAVRSDAQREWFARSAGWFTAAALLWAAATALVLFGSRIADAAVEGARMVLSEISAAGGLSAALAAYAAFNGKTPAQGASPSRLSQALGLLQAAGGQIFLVLLLVAVSAAVDLLILNGSLLDYVLMVARTPDEDHLPISNWIFGSTNNPAYGAVSDLFIGLLAAVAVALVVSRNVNINRFSLHDLYRNRLVRAYLGASNRKREPNRFTGFDMEDNPSICELWPEDPKERQGGKWRPYHVLNMTLNVVSTRNLAWQQRKAMSFIATPRHAGAADLVPVDDKQGHQSDYLGAYRPSKEYGGEKGISLGTAMAVSGAAANPNMGYNSSPSITLLLALFNVRLGWWLGNPGPEGETTWKRSGPRQAAEPWIMEAFGLTSANRRYINLSDGGHFENLGLYEMVRRRCRYIVLSDAGHDPTFNFADLGNAVRKIEIDLGVPIRFYGLEKMKPRPAARETLENVPYYAVGVIDYEAADGKKAEQGYILYVKPSYHGTEGVGVQAYAMSNPAFPHDSTADQWFDESQFESYRSLGFEIFDSLLRQARDTLGDNVSLPLVLRYLAQQAGVPFNKEHREQDVTRARGPAASEAALEP